MGERHGPVPPGAESFRVPQNPIILGESPHSQLRRITPDAIGAETLRLFGESGKSELLLGLRPEVLAAVAGCVSHMGLRFHDVSAAITEEQLRLSGKIKKGPVTLFRGGLVVANGATGLEIIDGSLGPLTKLVGGDFNRMITEPMSASLGPEFTVGQVRIAHDVLTARVMRGQSQRRAA